MRGVPPILLALLAFPAFAPLAFAPPAFAQDRPTSSGSGFLVADGRALTNNHVIAGCRRLTARNVGGQTAEARVLAADPKRDLALLALPGGGGKPLAIRTSPPVLRGEEVVAFGFPLSGVLSSGPTLTTGTISALAGLRDNPLHYQISAPVQPGNSGGPLLDSHGQVVGVVVSKLNAMRIAEMTGGDIPQNVNFAIKGTQARDFLIANNVTPRDGTDTGPDLKPAEIGEIANTAALFIRCYGTGAKPPATASAKPATDPSFRLINNGASPIAEVFATPGGSGNWGRNRLEGTPLPAGSARLFPLPKGTCRYDLKVVFADGKSRERRGTDLCKMTDLPVQ